MKLRRLVQKWSIQPRWPLLALGAILLCAIEPAFAQPTVRRGLIFVRVHCSQCHAIDKVGESPLAIAPPFRTLRLRYPVADLQRPLLEGNPSRDAPISAHAWSGVGYDGVSPNAQSLSALSSLSLKGASSRKSQLMAALRQHARPIVIGDPELGRPFDRLLRARKSRLWALGIVADPLSFAISRSLGADVEKHWLCVPRTPSVLIT